MHSLKVNILEFHLSMFAFLMGVFTNTGVRKDNEADTVEYSSLRVHRTSIPRVSTISSQWKSALDTPQNNYQLTSLTTAVWKSRRTSRRTARSHGYGSSLTFAAFLIVVAHYYILIYIYAADEAAASRLLNTQKLLKRSGFVITSALPRALSLSLQTAARSRETAGRPDTGWY